MKILRVLQVINVVIFLGVVSSFLLNPEAGADNRAFHFGEKLGLFGLPLIVGGITSYFSDKKNKALHFNIAFLLMTLLSLVANFSNNYREAQEEALEQEAILTAVGEEDWEEARALSEQKFDSITDGDERFKKLQDRTINVGLAAAESFTDFVSYYESQVTTLEAINLARAATVQAIEDKGAHEEFLFNFEKYVRLDLPKETEADIKAVVRGFDGTFRPQADDFKQLFALEAKQMGIYLDLLDYIEANGSADNAYEEGLSDELEYQNFLKLLGPLETEINVLKETLG